MNRASTSVALSASTCSAKDGMRTTSPTFLACARFTASCFASKLWAGDCAGWITRPDPTDRIAHGRIRGHFRRAVFADSIQRPRARRRRAAGRPPQARSHGACRNEKHLKSGFPSLKATSFHLKRNLVHCDVSKVERTGLGPMEHANSRFCPPASRLPDRPPKRPRRFRISSSEPARVLRFSPSANHRV